MRPLLRSLVWSSTSSVVIELRHSGSTRLGVAASTCSTSWISGVGLALKAALRSVHSSRGDTRPAAFEGRPLLQQLLGGEYARPPRVRTVLEQSASFMADEGLSC